MNFNPLMGSMDEETKRQILARALFQGGAGMLQGVGTGQPTSSILGGGAMQFLGGLDQATAMVLGEQRQKVRDEREGMQTNILRQQQQQMQQQMEMQRQQVQQRQAMADALPADMQFIRQGVLSGDPSSMKMAYSILYPQQFVQGPAGAVGLSGPGGQGVTDFRFPPQSPFGFLGGEMPPEAEQPPQAPAPAPAAPGIFSGLMPPASLEEGLQRAAGREATESAAKSEKAARERLTERLTSLMGKPDTTKFGIPAYSKEGLASKVSSMPLDEARAALGDIEAGFNSISGALKPRAIEFAHLLRKRIQELEGQ